MIERLEFNLSLIRHGQSAVNIYPDLMGQPADTELTQRGEEQARLLGASFLKRKSKFDFIFSSDYPRALNTAKLSLPEQKIELVPEIREYHAGDWTLTKRSETVTNDIKSKMKDLNMAFQPPNGESFTMMERRSSGWLESAILYSPSLLEFYKEHGPVNIACFSHGGTIKCLLHYIMGFDRAFAWRIKIDNTSVTKLSFGDEGWRLLGVNDVSHLEK